MIRALQVAVAMAGMVPVGAGLAGLLEGPSLAQPGIATLVSLDSHFRYLSGLLLGIGVAFWCLIPDITANGPAFRALTAIVVVGGIGRALSLALHGAPSAPMLFGLAMELLVTPALCLWQARITSRKPRPSVR